MMVSVHVVDVDDVESVFLRQLRWQRRFFWEKKSMDIENPWTKFHRLGNILEFAGRSLHTCLLDSTELGGFGAGGE